jgi:hypothetical protein
VSGGATPGGTRILAIMGSGETAPTMAKVHRALFERLGATGGSGAASGTGGSGAASGTGGTAPAPVPAAVIDTPYGFQENADELSARTVEFFATSVGRPVAVASYRSRDADAVTLATTVARIREARYVMAGPGSPSYALRQWAGGPIPAALAAKLAPGGGGGVLTMASAAALTVGIVTIPVYEVYKVGEEPRWLEGLDLLGPATGLRAAVVPHYDNAEGGTHDTRFCYMGERRLRVLEAALPVGAFVLGVDSHTALVLDLEAEIAEVIGLGGVTVRVDGRSAVFAAGSEVAIEAFGEAARELAAGQDVDVDRKFVRPSHADGATADGSVAGPRPHAPLRDTMADLEGTFIEALGRRDVRAAVGALLDLDSAISARVRHGEDSPDLDNASATFRALIARLGEGAEAGVRDPREAVAPFVEALLELRARARATRDWATADLVRHRLAAAGVEVRDGPDGSTWILGG